MGKTINPDNYAFEALEGQVKNIMLKVPWYSDANNHKTAGVYFSDVPNIGTNIPSGKAGMLVVIQSSVIGEENYAYQYFFATDGTIHYRSYNGASWSAWS